MKILFFIILAANICFFMWELKTGGLSFKAKHLPTIVNTTTQEPLLLISESQKQNSIRKPLDKSLITTQCPPTWPFIEALCPPSN